jgi:prepilin-type N-terminal cleavage/methylation domain-containing protein
LILSAQKRAERKGFSLTELMVVVAVIVILAGLVAGVVVKAIDASRTSTSLTTMEVIQSGLTRQLQQVIDGAKKGGRSPEEIYAVVRQAFPMNLNEARVGVQNLTTPYPPYQKSIGAAHQALDGQAQKSALLRLVLEKGPFSKVETDQLPKGALGQAGGVDIIRDAWGDPIGLEVQYQGTNATNTKPKFILSSPNTAKGGN